MLVLARTDAARKALVTLLTLAVTTTVFANDQQGVTDDGREILLKADGTWEFRSTDRFANTRDGHRVRLKADNTWEYVGNSPSTSNDQVRTTTLDIKFKEAVFEIHTKKIHKNIREETQTVFYLDIRVSPAAPDSITITRADISRIQVTDNHGKTYPVVSLNPSQITLAPGSQHRITIRAKGSPGILDNAKSMRLEIQAGTIGNETPISFSQKIRDIEKKQVEGFARTN